MKLIFVPEILEVRVLAKFNFIFAASVLVEDVRLVIGTSMGQQFSIRRGLLYRPPLPSSADYFLHGENGTRPNAFNFTYPLPSGPKLPAVFSIRGECRNCVVSSVGAFNLFDDAFRRRASMTVPVSSSELRLSRTMLENTPLDRCICPANIDPSTEGSGPTSAVFLEEFQEEVTELKEEGKLDGVEEVEAIIEVEDVNIELHDPNQDVQNNATGATCVRVEEVVTDGLVITLRGTTVGLSYSRILATSFSEAYNSLRPSRCSPLVIDANFWDDRRLQGITMQSNLNEVVRKEMNVTSMRRAVGLVLFRNQTQVDQVVRRMNEVLISRGIFSVVVGGIEMEVSRAATIPPVSTTAPTRRPSTSPTPVPSDHPSSLPSEEPSEQPSYFPSRTASQKPSTIPTDTPSISPSEQPTKSKTPDPTQSPSTLPSLEPCNLTASVQS